MSYDPKTGLPGMVRLEPGEMVNGTHVDADLLAQTVREKSAKAGASPQEQAAYYAETIHRAVAPTLRAA